LAALGALASARIKAQTTHAVPYDGGDRADYVVSAGANDERAAIQFGTVQLFVAIYLQKIAVGPLSFQISLPILVMLGHVVLMVITGRMQFAPLRLGCYLIFATFCLFSQAICGAPFSIPSVVELLLIYSFLTVTTYVSDATYQLILKRFLGMMVIPALIVLVQYWYQKITGLSNPIGMNHLLPKSVLLQGYFYDAHYPWNSPFQRPNGFFFLEPSIVSMFTASAAIIELTYFARTRYVLLMIAGTAFSMGGTGMTMLMIAAPFLVARQTLPVILLVSVTALIAILAVIALDVPLPMLQRANELHSTSTSGGGRILIPAQQFVRLLFDPSHFLTGTGAGSITAASGNPWPIVKLITEYGLLTTIPYVALYLMAVWRPYNVPLAVAISMIFHFTGGYLLGGTTLQFVAVMFCMIVPVSREGHEPPQAALSPRTHPGLSAAWSGGIPDRRPELL
jgi:hypothetical protein